MVSIIHNRNQLKNLIHFINLIIIHVKNLITFPDLTKQQNLHGLGLENKAVLRLMDNYVSKKEAKIVYIDVTTFK